MVYGGVYKIKGIPVPVLLVPRYGIRLRYSATGSTHRIGIPKYIPVQVIVPVHPNRVPGTPEYYTS
jgi:hypothetical protein